MKVVNLLTKLISYYLLEYFMDSYVVKFYHYFVKFYNYSLKLKSFYIIDD